MVKYQRDVREVALALELNPDHLRKWIRLYKQEFQGIESAGNAIIPEQREIQQLKAQIKRVEMEKEILKQAAVLMSESGQCGLFVIYSVLTVAFITRR